jgi:DNA-directed RNA polymerase subunit M/transcription elongation factor TFIIS
MALVSGNGDLFYEESSAHEFQHKTRNGEKKELNDDETLIFSDVEGTPHFLTTYKIIKFAPYLPYIKKVNIVCEKCKRTICSFYRVPDTSITFYVCLCGNIWN